MGPRRVTTLPPVLPGEGPPDVSAFDPAVRSALERIADPCSIATGVPVDLVDMGLILVAERTRRTARVVLQLTSTACLQIGIIAAKIRDEVGAIPGVDEVVVEIDHGAEWLPSMIASRADLALRERRPFGSDHERQSSPPLWKTRGIGIVSVRPPSTAST